MTMNIVKLGNFRMKNREKFLPTFVFENGLLPTFSGQIDFLPTFVCKI